MSSLSNPKFKDKEFLVSHISSIMDFYHPHCIDNEVGGFFSIFVMMEVFMISKPGTW